MRSSTNQPSRKKPFEKTPFTISKNNLAPSGMVFNQKKLVPIERNGDAKIVI